MDTKDIRCFVRCYEERSINKAAKELFITPQGLSRVIGHLEEEFQIQLFQRSARGIHPTEAGHLFYRDAIELLQKLESIEISMKRLKERGQKVKIGYAYGVLHILPFYKIEQYKKDHDNLSIRWEEIANAKVKEMVRRGELDIGYVVGNVGDDHIQETELYSTKLYAFIYEGHPFYNKESISIKDLKGEPLITLNEKYQCYSALIQRCRDFGFVPDVAMKTMESQLIYQFCEQKIGIGIDVNIHRIREFHPSLHCIEIKDITPWIIYMINQNGKEKEQNIKDILKFTKEICRKK